MTQINLKVKGIPFSLDTSVLIPAVKEAVPQLSDADYIDLYNEIVTLITEENARRKLNE